MLPLVSREYLSSSLLASLRSSESFKQFTSPSLMFRALLLSTAWIANLCLSAILVQSIAFSSALRESSSTTPTPANAGSRFCCLQQMLFSTESEKASALQVATNSSSSGISNKEGNSVRACPGKVSANGVFGGGPVTVLPSAPFPHTCPSVARIFPLGAPKTCATFNISCRLVLVWRQRRTKSSITSRTNTSPHTPSIKSQPCSLQRASKSSAQPASSPGRPAQNANDKKSS
mmetsp:Transcript_18967/g.47550  ORF Transcript_18967/g.47550 Transcript_18967/m.47550 type:complete len:232 (+) Transcript_18967:460-1155(+)